MTLELEKEINELGRRFSDTTIFMHEAIARRAGLSATDHKYLSLLIRHGAMTAGDFAKQSGLTTGAITGLVDRLEQKGFVKREFDKIDRRKVMIVPDLERSEQLVGPLFAELQQQIRDLVGQYTEQERGVIKNYLASAISIMEQITNDIIKTS